MIIEVYPVSGESESLLDRRISWIRRLVVGALSLQSRRLNRNLFISTITADFDTAFGYGAEPYLEVIQFSLSDWPS